MALFLLPNIVVQLNSIEVPILKEVFCNFDYLILTDSSTTFRGQGVDLWAAGITLYCFLFGKVSPWYVQLELAILRILVLECPFPSSNDASILKFSKELPINFLGMTKRCL